MPAYLTELMVNLTEGAKRDSKHRSRRQDESLLTINTRRENLRCHGINIMQITNLFQKKYVTHKRMCKLHFVIFVFLPQIKTSDALVKSIQHQGPYSFNPLIQCCINLFTYIADIGQNWYYRLKFTLIEVNRQRKLQMREHLNVHGERACKQIFSDHLSDQWISLIPWVRTI